MMAPDFTIAPIIRAGRVADFNARATPAQHDLHQRVDALGAGEAGAVHGQSGSREPLPPSAGQFGDASTGASR